MYNDALAHFTAFTKKVGRSYKKVGHLEPIVSVSPHHYCKPVYKMILNVINSIITSIEILNEGNFKSVTDST